MKRKKAQSTTLTSQEKKTLSKILAKARAAKAAKAAQQAQSAPNQNSGGARITSAGEIIV